MGKGTGQGREELELNRGQGQKAQVTSAPKTAQGESFRYSKGQKCGSGISWA